MSQPRTPALVLVLIAIALVVGACGTSSTREAVTKVGGAEARGMLASRVVIDVRTPAEFATGHIAGARNIDVDATDFSSRIASLDRKGAYLVYCRSGRRSATAAERMAAAGFTDVADAGAMSDLVAAGAVTE